MDTGKSRTTNIAISHCPLKLTHAAFIKIKVKTPVFTVLPIFGPIGSFIATIDLGEQKAIQSISLGCLQNYRDWIFLPQSVSFEVSTDGLHFTLLQVISNLISVNETKPLLHDFTAQFPVQQVKWIRVSAKNIGVCPKGHNGEGQPAWLFADEMVVK